MPAVVMLVVLLLLGGCARDPQGGMPGLYRERAVIGEPKIQFLGVGGWLLHWRGEGVLLAPSFSNPAAVNSGFLPPARVVADHKRIDLYMPRADDVSMLLVGHGHYDHLLDVPWVMKKHSPKALVYGSSSVAHMLRAMVDPKRVVNAQWAMARLEERDGTWLPPKPGTWLYSTGGRIRAMPIQSQHAGHVAGINLIPGRYVLDLKEVPVYIWQWKPGQPMAWLIDLLDESGKNPVYRLHYQDSGAPPPLGFPPALADGKGIDVEILSAASWTQVPDYPWRLLTVTRPRMVLIGHWENFFGNDPYRPRPLPGLKLQPFLDTIACHVARGVPVVLPAPLAVIPLPPAQPTVPALSCPAPRQAE
ncbi:MBL fold metallo-hydrolase [Pseudomonas chlororaphis]|uniref:MBL fold metallo-hydrolase n=1 Tax=Pseudomonas chlororaphis TaxID=587753 RepID=UPI001FF09FF2|nr:hypothetical protein [Pseudomonas chlororaphis]